MEKFEFRCNKKCPDFVSNKEYPNAFVDGDYYCCIDERQTEENAKCRMWAEEDEK